MPGLLERCLIAISRFLIARTAAPGSYGDAFRNYQAGRFERALAILDGPRPSKQQAPTLDAMTSTLRGDCLWALERRDEAIDAWRSALRGGDNAALLRLGRTAVELSSSELAVEVLAALSNADRGVRRIFEKDMDGDLLRAIARARTANRQRPADS